MTRPKWFMPVAIIALLLLLLASRAARQEWLS